MSKQLASAQFDPSDVIKWAENMLKEIAAVVKQREDETVLKHQQRHARFAALPIIRWLKLRPPTREEVLAGLTIREALYCTASFQEDEIKQILTLARLANRNLAKVTLTAAGCATLGKSVNNVA